MLYGLLFFIGLFIGFGIAVLLVRHWNKEIIDNQKEDIKTLCSEGFIKKAKK